MRRTHELSKVKRGFRHCYYWSGSELTLCGDCREKIRETQAAAIVFIPLASELLECESCHSVNETAALAEEVEVHCNFSDSREEGKRRYELEPPSLPKG